MIWGGPPRAGRLGPGGRIPFLRDQHAERRRGQLAADEGEVTWNGSPLTRAARQRFGYMPEERGLYPKMTVADQVVYLGQLHGLDRIAAVRRTDEAF
jgi:ABC-type branched-subunit amino acid transport system ATPase component